MADTVKPAQSVQPSKPAQPAPAQSATSVSDSQPQSASPQQSQAQKELAQRQQSAPAQAQPQPQQSRPPASQDPVLQSQQQPESLPTQSAQQQPATQPPQAQASSIPQSQEPTKPTKKAKKKKNKKSLLSSLLPGSANGGEKKSTKTGTSTQKFLKIKGIRNGFLELEDGSFKAIIMASSVNFSLMSGDEQKAMLFGYQEFLNSLEFPIQITVQSRILNINNYLSKLTEAEKMQENELMKIQIGAYQEYIKSLVELANITTNRYYVIISYTGSPGSTGKESAMDKVKQFINPAREAKVEIESYDRAIQELNLRVSRVVQGLRSMGIRAANLNTQEVVELFYTIYNPELSGSQVLAELERLNIEVE